MTRQEATQKLFQAARSGNVSDAEAALAAGANLNAEIEWKQMPLHEAAVDGHTDIARLLIEKGADLNAKDDQQKTPLDWAVENSHADLVTILQDAGKPQPGHADRVKQGRADDQGRTR